MDISVVIFFFIISIYIASLVTAICKKKLEGLFKKVFKFINLKALFFTILITILWMFNLHLNNLTIEVLPFWTFIISSIILFGLTITSKMEKTFYGIIFFGHLFLTVIIIVPFIGLGLTSMIYARFLPDNILYQDKNVIIVDEVDGFLAPKPSPTVYIKCGLFTQKFHTNLSPVYLVDSVSIKTLEKGKVEVEIHGDKENTARQRKQTLDCNCI